MPLSDLILLVIALGGVVFLFLQGRIVRTEVQALSDRLAEVSLRLEALSEHLGRARSFERAVEKAFLAQEETMAAHATRLAELLERRMEELREAPAPAETPSGGEPVVPEGVASRLASLEDLLGGLGGLESDLAALRDEAREQTERLGALLERTPAEAREAAPSLEDRVRDHLARHGCALVEIVNVRREGSGERVAVRAERGSELLCGHLLFEGGTCVERQLSVPTRGFP